MTYADDDLDPDMALCKNLRDQVDALYLQTKIKFNTKCLEFPILANFHARLQRRTLRTFGKQ